MIHICSGGGFEPPTLGYEPICLQPFSDLSYCFFCIERKVVTRQFSHSQDNSSKLKDQVLRVFFLEQVKGIITPLVTF